MNSEKILQMIKPYVKGNQLTYDDFEKIFDMLTRREKYLVSDLVQEQLKISLVDEISFLSNNEEIIEETTLQMILPYVENKQLTYDEFEKIFKSFSRNEKYFIVRFIEEKLKFSLVDEKTLPPEMPLISRTAKKIKLSNNMLVSLVKNGDRQALQDLCIKNRGLVDKYAQLYSEKFSRRLDFEDLEQLGMLAIIEATKRFDFSKETQFSTYATYWIWQIMNRSVIDTGFMVRLPVHIFEKIKKARALDLKFYKQGKNNSERLKLIAAEINLTLEGTRKLFALYNAFINIKSLDEPIGEDEDTARIELLPTENQESPEDVITKGELREKIDELLETLTDREKKVLVLRYGLEDNRERTLEEIGKIFNLTRERIRQIEVKALKKLRHPSRSKKLKDFVQ